MATPDQGELNLSISRSARDAGMALVASHGKLWIAAAMEKVIRQLPNGWRGQMEDLRVLIEDVVGKPHHPNIYGSLTRIAVKEKVLYYPGEMRNMRRKSSHARRTLLLAKLNHADA